MASSDKRSKRHQDLLACKVCRKRHNPRGEAGSGDLAAINSAPQDGLHGLDANASDQHQLTPMVDAVEAAMGRKPDQVSADAGYCSDTNLAAMEERAIDAYIAAGRAKHPTDGEGGGKRVAAMREKIRAGGHDTPYRMRKQLPEPVFGQIKQARGFRQFLMRGLDKVAHEWGLVCLAHNMLKLAQGRTLTSGELLKYRNGLLMRRG